MVWFGRLQDALGQGCVATEPSHSIRVLISRAQREGPRAPKTSPTRGRPPHSVQWEKPMCRHKPQLELLLG